MNKERSHFFYLNQLKDKDIKSVMETKSLLVLSQKELYVDHSKAKIYQLFFYFYIKLSYISGSWAFLFLERSTEFQKME